MSTSVDPRIAARSEKPTVVWERTIPRSNGRPDGHSRTDESSYLAYILVDLLFVVVNAAVVFSSRFLFDSLQLSRQAALAKLLDPVLLEQIGFLAIYAVLLLLTMGGQGLYQSYRPRSFVDDTFALSKSVFFATLLLIAIIYISNVKTVSRVLVVFTGALDWATLILWRWWFRGVVERRVARGEASRNILIVADNGGGESIARYLDDHKHLGYLVKGFLVPTHNGHSRLLGHIEDFPEVARAHFIDEVLIVPPLAQEAITKVVWSARRQRINVKIVPDALVGLGRRTRWDYVGDLPVVEIHKEPIPAFGLILKRAFDILISTMALIIMFPVVLVCIIAIRLESPGPIFYRSLRVGQKGKKFICYKLRTMVEGADELKERFLHLNERKGLLFKITDDPRATSVGKILRKYSVDEIPQFWNVLKGDMSIVGPRPPVVSEYDRYSLEHLRRMDVMPGITGRWQVSARKDSSFENYVALDLEYIENWSVWLDMKIMLQTVLAVVRGTGH